MNKIIYIFATIIFTFNIQAQCFKTLATGKNHALGIKVNGTLWAWGLNFYGELGDGTTIPRQVPTQIGTANNWQKISAGFGHTLAIKTDGTLWAWGNNNFGQLGINSTTLNSLVPVQVGTANNWHSISAGSEFSVALKTDGTLWTWGNNFNTQLGIGVGSNKLIPTQVGTDTDWELIAAGNNYTLASKLGGSLYSWGANGSGQLGIGNTTPTSVPTLVNSAIGWKSISAGLRHNLAIKDDNTLWAWGNNSHRQIGDNTNVNRITPIQIGTDTNWFSVEAGNDFSVALKSNSTLWTWGLNNEGQLGDGTQTEKWVPTQIAPTINWTSISAGGWQVIALNFASVFSTNTYSWGNNEFGQLGHSWPFSQSIPILLNNCSTLSIEETSPQNIFSLYPNPAKDYINIQNKNNFPIKNISIYDAFGKKVMDVQDNNSTINVQNLSAGIYLLKIYSEENSFQTKFIKN